MNIHILGSAAAEGWPGVFCECGSCMRALELGGKNIRSRSGTLVDETTLIDFGPDLYMQSIRDNVRLSKVNYALITHSHQDHFNFLEFYMRQPPFAHIARKQPLILYGNKAVGDLYRFLMTSAQVNPGVEYVQAKAFEKLPVDDGYALPLPAVHDKSEECFIYMLERGGKRMLYGHDTMDFPQQTLDALAGMKLDFAMLDCTMGDTTCVGGTHMGFGNCVRMKDLMLKNGAADAHTVFVVTHFSHNINLMHEDLEALAGPEGFLVAWDGVRYTV